MKSNKIFPAEMCLGRKFELLLDLFRGISSQELKLLENNYVTQLKEKLNLIYEWIRQQLDSKSQKIKTLYDYKA